MSDFLPAALTPYILDRPLHAHSSLIPTKKTVNRNEIADDLQRIRVFLKPVTDHVYIPHETDDDNKICIVYAESRPFSGATLVIENCGKQTLSVDLCASFASASISEANNAFHRLLRKRNPIAESVTTAPLLPEPNLEASFPESTTHPFSLTSCKMETKISRQHSYYWQIPIAPGQNSFFVTFAKHCSVSKQLPIAFVVAASSKQQQPFVVEFSNRFVILSSRSFTNYKTHTPSSFDSVSNLHGFGHEACTILRIEYNVVTIQDFANLPLQLVHEFATKVHKPRSRLTLKVILVAYHQAQHIVSSNSKKELSVVTTLPSHSDHNQK